MEESTTIERLSHVTVLVRDCDEALEFYTKMLGFEKVEDALTPSGDRWLTVAPAGGRDVQIVLQQPGDATPGGAEEMRRRVGQATTWVFQVDDCRKTCDELAKKGVRILSPPQDLGFATEAMFADLYGNPFILMQPSR